MNEYKTKEQQRKFYKSSTWQKLRRLALERDRYECVWCRAEGKVTTKEHATLEVDHIAEIETNPELAEELSNLRTLCRSCHNLRHNRFGFVNKKPNKWSEDEKW